MASDSMTLERVRRLILESLNVVVSTDDTDLIDSGLIDSLALITIIAEIEQEFRLELPLDDLDVEQFRSVRRIAEFVADMVQWSGELPYRMIARESAR